MASEASKKRWALSLRFTFWTRGCYLDGSCVSLFEHGGVILMDHGCNVLPGCNVLRPILNLCPALRTQKLACVVWEVLRLGVNRRHLRSWWFVDGILTWSQEYSYPSGFTTGRIYQVYVSNNHLELAPALLNPRSCSKKRTRIAILFANNRHQKSDDFPSA